MIERLVKNTLSAYKDMPIEFCKDFLNMPLIWQGQQKILKSLWKSKPSRSMGRCLENSWM